MRVKELLLENWSLKLISFLLAFILWLLVRGDPNAERVISVPLEIRVPRNMELTSERPSTVDVTVRGAFANMGFAPVIPTYVIDMQSFDEGPHVIQLSPANVRFPRASGLEAVAVRPVRLVLKLERTIAKEVPVRAALRGAPAPGFDIYSTSISPPSVIVSGPRSSVEGIDEMYTEAVSIADLRQSLREFANIYIRDDSVHCTPPGPVEVNVQVGPHRRQLRITGLIVVPDIEDVRITPRDVAIQVLVPITYTKPLTAAEFNATVANSKMEEATQVAKLPVEVHPKGQLDPAILIKSIQPSEVTVRRTK